MENFMEVGQGPNWGCSAKEKKYYAPSVEFFRIDRLNTVKIFIAFCVWQTFCAFI
jgi:hypothetical protein